MSVLKDCIVALSLMFLGWFVVLEGIILIAKGKI